MRLWHKALIHVLPKKQLIGQWRECCSIAKNIAEKGTPNHLLVNRIMDYPLKHFWYYSQWVSEEMISRGYRCDFDKFDKIYPFCGIEKVTVENLFRGWHDDQYLIQCFYNLQEKFDCGGITDEEYSRIHSLMIQKGIRV